MTNYLYHFFVGVNEYMMQILSQSYIIPEAVLRSVFRLSVGQKFYIQLALPISPEIMDRFLYSWCLNNRIEVPNMIRLFAGGTTTPW